LGGAVATSNYQQLHVWQNGRELARLVYELTRSFPRSEALGLSSQMQRAAVSVAANVAEGHTRGTTKEFLRYVAVAHGSLAELETLLFVAQDLGYVDVGGVAEIRRLCGATSRMLSGLRRKLRSKLAGDGGR
jgi:four helix bundle protein